MKMRQNQPKSMKINPTHQIRPKATKTGNHSNNSKLKNLKTQKTKKLKKIKHSKLEKSTMQVSENSQSHNITELKSKNPNSKPHSHAAPLPRPLRNPLAFLGPRLPRGLRPPFLRVHLYPLAVFGVFFTLVPSVPTFPPPLASVPHPP